MLLAVVGLTVAVPADGFSEGLANPDDYDDDDDVFVPITDKENFDVFDWQLCKVKNPLTLINILYVTN